MRLTRPETEQLPEILCDRFKRLNLGFSNEKVQLTESFSILLCGSEFLISVEFDCSEQEYNYIKDIKHIDTCIHQHYESASVIDIPAEQLICMDLPPIGKIKTVYRCTYFVILMDASLPTFVSNFVKELAPLYKAVESSRFDGEIDKLMDDDGYNK